MSGRYVEIREATANPTTDQMPVAPSFDLSGWALISELIARITAGQARYLLRVTMISPERNMPEVLNPSLDSRCQVFGRVTLDSSEGSLGSS